MRRFLLKIAATAATLSIATAANASAWRSTITLPDDPFRIRPLDAFVIADQLGDHAAARAALEREGWPTHLRDWHEALLASRSGDIESTQRHFDAAAREWPEDEPELLGRIFDRERLRFALEHGEAADARGVLEGPVVPHDDAVWSALVAWLDLREGRIEEAARGFATAWEDADELARRDPVFLQAPGAWISDGDPSRAVEAWHGCLSVLRRPERLRLALSVWDQLAPLREAVAAAEDPGPTLRFLVRTLRRDEAMAIVRARLDAQQGDRVEQELFVAEQMYRLRQHDELLAWLAARVDDAWGGEQQASAEGYRWGVERRRGSTLDVARGFDGVAERWPDTDRAAEAWWEAAWMYELNDDFDAAIKRYARHVAATDGGSFRTSAALRTGLLAWRQGDRQRALANFEAFADDLGTGMDQAAAWWLTELAGAGPTALRSEHPASPFWRGAEPELGPAEAPSVVSLYRIQRDGFLEIAARLGATDSLQEFPEELVAIARVAEIGLRTEATILLEDWARENRRDDLARLRVAWIAFRWGLPEIQARQGWFLQVRLGGQDPVLDAALHAASLPTPFGGAVLQIAAGLDLPPALLWALMRRESFFDADVVSLAGAYGLMQLLPTTAARVARAAGTEAPDAAAGDLFVPSVNVFLGATYLSGLRDEAKGNWIRALSAYNAGEANGERWEARLRDGEPPELGILLISYSETRSYVYNVLRVAHLYEDVWRGGAVD